MNKWLILGLGGLLLLAPGYARAAEPAEEDLPKKLTKLMEEL